MPRTDPAATQWRSRSKHGPQTLTQGADVHIVVSGGVSLWRLDLIDELQLSMFPDVAGEGTRLFDAVPTSHQLDLISSTAFSNGVVELQYRRHR